VPGQDRSTGLRSERLRLQPLGRPELRAILAGEPDRDLPWAEGFPSEALLAFLRQVQADDTLLGPFYAYLIVREPDGVLVGDAGFHGPPGPEGEVEIGYALAPPARGRGLATEAVRLLARWRASSPGSMPWWRGWTRETSTRSDQNGCFESSASPPKVRRTG